MEIKKIKFLQSKNFTKKGMFLTFISIAMIAAVIIIFTPSSVELKKDIPAVKARVSNVNSYVYDLENVYLKDTLQASGRRAIIAIIEYMETNGFLTNFENDFKQVILEGTIGDPPETLPLMTDKTFIDLKNEIVDTAITTFNVDTEFAPIERDEIRVYQARPWFVEVEADVSFIVTTAEGTASWERAVTIKTDISIENFEDPYYIVNTKENPGGIYVNKIRQSPINFDEWDVNKVMDFIDNGDYTHFRDSKAPSFIGRFTNDLTPSECCGIESLVDPNKLQSLGLDSDRDVSYVDYLFWSTEENCAAPPFNLYRINAIHTDFPGFKLNLGTLSRYNLPADKQLCPLPE